MRNETSILKIEKPNPNVNTQGQAMDQYRRRALRWIGAAFASAAVLGVPNLASASALADKVKQMIVTQLGVSADQVVPDALFMEDLGVDSIGTVELVMAFEDEFGIDIPDDDSSKLLTVAQVITYIMANSDN